MSAREWRIVDGWKVGHLVVEVEVAVEVVVEVVALGLDRDATRRAISIGATR